ncbi:hypothetical protein [Odoribacter lunatus]|uniref:hypothetical protein n=1 Tax=Odoribacter lunatus TaxID=2941335 RepID=UPI0020411B7D|nr:hypothetical protein [Odoribacter lunatus]
MKIKPQLVLSSMMGLLFSACNVSNQTSGRVADDGVTKFGDGVDSIKVEVSTKVGGTRSIILKENADAVARFENKPDSTLSSSTTEELIGLADSLFVEKNREIILSQEDAEGRTGYPIFTVSLYKDGQGETTRYDMGTQEGNITHCTTCDIHYSPEFRHFLSKVFEILN